MKTSGPIEYRLISRLYALPWLATMLILQIETFIDLLHAADMEKLILNFKTLLLSGANAAEALDSSMRNNASFSYTCRPVISID